MKTLRIEIVRHEFQENRIVAAQIIATNNVAYRLYTVDETDERYTSLVAFVGADTAAAMKAADLQAHVDFDEPED